MADHTKKTSWRIFHDYFLVLIPDIFAREDEFNILGIPKYNSPEAEQLAMYSKTVRQLTINEMVELHHRGCTDFTFERPGDAETVYKLLEDHLLNFKARLESLNPGKIPFDDLAKMDAFQQLIHPVKRRFETVDGGLPFYERQAQKLFSSRRFSRTTERAKAVQANNSEVRGQAGKRVRRSEIYADRNPITETSRSTHNSIVDDISHLAVRNHSHLIKE